MTKPKEETIQNKLVVKRTVMEPVLSAKAEDIIKKCFEQTISHEELSLLIKDELEKNCGGFGWNVVLGQDFGSYIFHNSKYFAFYKIGKLDIVIWKC